MSQPREQITVTISTDGSVVATTHGIKGAGCLDYIRLLEDILEAETTASIFTTEYNETTHSGHHEATNDLHQQ